MNKKKASEWMSRYCRLRDGIEYCRKYGVDVTQFNRPEDLIVKCCTCGAVKSWIYMDGGHFIGRSIGGSSGVYFDERNNHAQCGQCNAFKQGSPKEYEEFMLLKYSQAVVDELRLKDKTNNYKGQIEAIGLMYKEMYEDLVRSL